jgi:hypothetical protein
MQLAANHRPTIGVAIGAFIYSLALWGINELAAVYGLPPDVVLAARVLALALCGVIVGYVTEYIGKSAPWSVTSHQDAIVDALKRDPNELHAGDIEAFGLGPDDLDRLRDKDQW